MLAQLVAYLRAHDHEAYPHGPNLIHVVTVLMDGSEELDVIPATLPAVREWLADAYR